MQRLLKYHKIDRTKIFALFLFHFSFFINGWATTYYIDAKHGKDTNDGLTESNAWKTISKVNNSDFLPGDNILFKKGDIWREQITVHSSGAIGNPITFCSYGNGGKPVINGAEIISNWSEVDGNPNLWKATCDNIPETVYFDGKRGNRVNDVSDLDSDNEWFNIENNLYQYSINDPDIRFRSPGIESSLRNFGIHILGNYITISDLHIKYVKEDGIRIYPPSNISICGIVIKDNIVEETRKIGIKISNRNANENLISDVKINNNIIHSTGFHGIHNIYNVSNVLISNNIVYNGGWNLNGHGISMWSNSQTRYPNNIVVEYNEVFGWEDGDITEGTGIQADDNTRNIIIRYNYSHNNQGTGIKVNRADSVNIYYNLCINNGDNDFEQDAGIVIENAGYNNIFNNTIYKNSRNGIFLIESSTNKTTNNSIVNNIIAENGKNEIWIYKSSINDATTNFFSDYNLIYHPNEKNYMKWAENPPTDWIGWKLQSSQDVNSLPPKDPQFIAAGSNNFKLKSSSPCIDAGANVGLLYDYVRTLLPQGNKVDIGASEFNVLRPPKKFRVIEK
jgi:parallel beta-helix repeat protein